MTASLPPAYSRSTGAQPSANNRALVVGDWHLTYGPWRAIVLPAMKYVAERRPIARGAG